MSGAPLNAAPKETFEAERIPQPWFPVSAAEQSVCATSVPVIPSAEADVEGMLHPGFVWMVA
jgi:hypothetical protein